MENENDSLPTSPTVENEIETAESLQAHIAELQTKLAAKEAEEEAAEAEFVELPLANVHLRLNDKMSFMKPNLTPPELLVLVAMHHTNSGGNPVDSVTPIMDGDKVKTIKADVRAIKATLGSKYGKDRIEKLYPGVSPSYPKRFKTAISLGLGSVLPAAHLFTMGIKDGSVNALAPLE